MTHIPAPELRRRLDLVADALEEPAACDLAALAAEVRFLSEGTRQDPLVRPRADAVSTKVTDEVAAEIVAYADAHPGLAQHRIAAHFNVNQGQVSMAITGKRWVPVSAGER